MHPDTQCDIGDRFEATPAGVTRDTGRGLDTRSQPRTAALWVVGAHGGAGESTLAAFDDTWQVGGQAWPITDDSPAPCVLVARANLTGLLAAQAALAQWASPATRPPVDLAGLVLVADAAGKPPKALRDLSVLVAGGAPRSWRLAWVEAWRTDPVDPATAPASVRRVIDDLRDHLAQRCPLPALASSDAGDARDVSHRVPVRDPVKEG